MKKWFKPKRSYLLLASVAGLIWATMGLQNHSLQLKKLSVLGDGISTCFGRVGQTYTAKLIGDTGSLFLNKSFIASTEECFGETISNLEQNFKGALASHSKKLNGLASDVHWFHEKVKQEADAGLVGNTTRVLISNIGARFERLEIKKEEFVEKLDGYREAIIGKLNFFRWAFYALALLTPLFGFWEVLSNRSREENNAQSEEEAANLLDSDDYFDRSEAERIIRKSLQANGLPIVGKLYDTYNALYAAKGTAAAVTDSAGKAVMLNTSDPKAVDEQVEKVWKQSESATSKMPKPPVKPAKRPSKGTSPKVPTWEDKMRAEGFEPVQMEGVINKGIDLISAKLFTKGVELDINVEDKIKIWSKADIIEQAVFHIMTHYVDGAVPGGNMGLKIETRQLGSTVLLDFTCGGAGFDEDFIKAQNGVKAASDDSSDNIDLKVSRELVSQLGTKVSFENIANEDGRVVGSKVQLVFRAVSRKAAAGKIRQLKRGTKREVLNSMNH